MMRMKRLAVPGYSVDAYDYTLHWNMRLDVKDLNKELDKATAKDFGGERYVRDVSRKAQDASLELD